MVITIPSHGLTTDNEIRIELNSLTFACTKDGNKTTHSYPRATDPAAQRWLRIEEKTDDTVKVNVGIGALPINMFIHLYLLLSTALLREIIQLQLILVNHQQLLTYLLDKDHIMLPQVHLC
ncbi:MAG: hypothetical protein CM15mV11_0290 [Caudoviricetes sp.]|nr:MAG: hypothetical protein CM15mV11_0290 [Caudoviricetes sp.]